MSDLGHKRKGSDRGNVFRFALESRPRIYTRLVAPALHKSYSRWSVWIQPSITASRKRGERVTGKSRAVTFRMDQATWQFMRELVPYMRYGKASSFIREGIELLLQQ